MWTSGSTACLLQLVQVQKTCSCTCFLRSKSLPDTRPQEAGTDHLQLLPQACACSGRAA